MSSRRRAASKRRWQGSGQPSVVETLEERCLLSATLWSQRGGDAGHTSYVDESYDPSTLTDAWFEAVGYPQSGTGSWSERAVAIDETHVYRTALEGYAPSGTYHVIAYDLQSGQEVWHRTFASGAFEGVGEPSVANGIVYINRAGHSGISGGTDSDLPRIYGLDAATGATVLEHRYAAQWGSNERPVIADGQLVVEDGYYGGISAYTASTLSRQWFIGRSAAYNPPFASLDDQYAYAFGNEVYRRSDGTRVQSIVHPYLTTVTDSMVSGSDRVLFDVSGYYDGANRFGVSAFDGDTHQHLWTTLTAVSPTAKAVGNGIVAVASGSNLLLLNEADGSLIRSWQAPSNLSSEIVMTRSHVFVQSASSGLARVHAIDIATGQEVWSFENRVSSGSAVMEMAFGNDHLLLSTHLFVRAFSIEKPVPVSIDVLPTDPENQVSLRSKQIQVAILATEQFNPLLMLDLSSLRLRAATSEMGATVASHPKHGFKYEQLDVNGDGLLDLVVSFKTSDTGLTSGDTSVVLEGNLLPEFGGDDFSVEQAITLLNGGGKGRNGNRK